MAGGVTNTALATGAPPTGPPVTDISDSAHPSDGPSPSSFGTGTGDNNPTVQSFGPIDPSGIIYNSVTRAPVAGVTVTINDSSDTPLPLACLVDPSQQNQETVADGAYRFDIVPGADPACPTEEREYRISVVGPAGYVTPGVSTTMPAETAALEVTNCPIDAIPGGSCQVVASATPPISPAPQFYYLAFLLELNDPHVVNNHIAIDPPTSAAPGFTKRALVTAGAARRARALCDYGY